MRLTLSFPTLFVVLSFFSISIATIQPGDHVARISLERKSFIAHNRGAATCANKAMGYVDGKLLKAHLVDVAMKYRATLAAYESNTGSPHPLAQEISATSSEFLAAGEKISDAGTSLSAGRLEKRRGKGGAGPGLSDPTPPSHVPRGHAKRDDISLTDLNANMWMGPISVGTPQQNFTVDFDTGSADLILPSQACDSSCNGHARYNYTASSTSVSLGKTFQLAYSGGSNVYGTEYTDNVYMGGYEAVNQTLGAATTYSSGLEIPTFRPDGLVGMAFPSISSLRASPVFQTMISNNVVPQGVFGFALSSQPGKSELTIGGTNTNLYQQSTMEYVNVSLAAYWQIPLAGLTRPGLNNTPDVVVVNETSYAQALVDTGTTMIITSDQNAQAYYANVPGAKPSADIGGGIWSVPCDTIGLLAPTLTFGSHSYTVSPSTFNLGPVSQGSTDCIAGLAGGGSPYWIIGDVFLQNVYTVFDVVNSRIGFADLA